MFKSGSIDLCKVIVASLKLSAHFCELIWSSFKTLVVNGQLKSKGPVKLIQQVKIAHSFFTVYVKSVPLYYFKLAYVVLHMAVKEFFETHFKKWRNKLF